MDFQLDKPVFFPESPVDLLAVGEVLIDLITEEKVTSLAEAEKYKRHFGGSPANIAMNLAALGKKSALISRVGFDGIGEYLITTLKKRGVLIDGVKVDSENNTTIVLVTSGKDSPRFIAYRGADKYIESNDIEPADIQKTKIVHLSTFALSASTSRRAIEKIIRIAKDKNKLIALDPNYRAKLWEGEGHGIGYIQDLFSKIDVIKPSLDDAKAIFGTATKEEYIKFFHEAGCKLVILTLGEKGVIISDNKNMRKFNTEAARVVDTTGAGDAFWSGFYTGLLSGYTINKSVKIGNAVAAEVIKAVGAIIDLPNIAVIIEKYNLNG
ncbi:MAG: carbohydrate kinase family protein [Bacillota bacterium]